MAIAPRKLAFDYVNPFAVYEFKNIINDIRPDLIHFHSFYGISSFLLRLAKTKYPTVVTLHDSWIFFYDSSIISPNFEVTNSAWKLPLGHLHRKINQNFFRGCTLVSPSMWMKGFVERHGFQSPTHIPNGLLDKGSTTAYRDILLWVGDITKFKGLPLVISTIADIIARTGWRFVVVGDGPYRHELEIRYPTVEFVGRCDPISYYHEASILIVSSIGYDNFPTVILEGMRHGLCVVGNRIGGIPEIVKDGQTGLLYQSQESLQEQIEKLIVDSKALQQLGRAARTSFDRNYLWDKCYDKYFNLYQAVINNG
jgi:glycosyltransferase involved in cell wall biosynthesis